MLTNELPPIDDLEYNPPSRRSLASLYADNRIGSVRLPTELQDIISSLIQGPRSLDMYALQKS